MQIFVSHSERNPVPLAHLQHLPAGMPRLSAANPGNVHVAYTALERSATFVRHFIDVIAGLLKVYTPDLLLPLYANVRDAP